MNEVSVLVGADVVPSLSNQIFFEKGTLGDVFDDELIKIWGDADARVFNLETPLYDGFSKIKKCGPHLISSTQSVNGLKLLTPDLVLLANNHIMDHGLPGLNSTLNTLQSNGIDFVGVGQSILRMKKFHIIEKNDIKIAFYNCAEHEFSIASTQRCGANPFDFIDSFDDVADLKNNNDFVVVCYHGGKEFYPYPSPNLQRIFRKFADKGADVVVAQHTHCIGCYEEYNNATLIYGQGNFLFNMKTPEYSPYGLILRLSFSKQNVKTDYIPVSLSQGKLVKLNRNASCLERFLYRSEQIKEQNFVLKNYSLFAKESFPFYLRMLRGNSFFSKFFYKLSKRILIRFAKKENLTAIRNFIECESHRELLLEGLRDD